MQTDFPLADYMAARRKRIDEALDRYTSRMPTVPARLKEAMRYSLLTGGKRIRPLLTLMAAEACGGSEEAALPAACAMEMVHIYSLIHDDLPAMDDDDLRHGNPTNHKVYGDGLAILAGDGLLTLAFQTLAEEVRPAELARSCIATLAAAAGPSGMVGGQADDLACENNGGDLNMLESVHLRKTGVMLIAALRLGAMTAGANSSTQSVLEDYGRKLGLAFQVTDDLLDVRGSEDATGKRVGKDSNRGKLTFPALLGIDESYRRAEELTNRAVDALAPLGMAAAPLAAVARYVLERDR